MAKSKELYVRLGLKETATDNEIRGAYTTLINGLAPDSSDYLRLTEAYDILSNINYRAEYDVTGKIPKLKNSGNKQHTSKLSTETLITIRKALNTIFLIGTVITVILYILKMNGHSGVPFFAVGITALIVKIIEFILRLLF
ncbi:MAG: DnaJ domain-containing protein [Bacteroidaceae bacterium]|nr:DnaJ domain-containing protein [Bacteroidaceae bacterium]